MSILTGKQIIKEWADGRVQIFPMDESQVSCNSYDLRLGPKLLVTKEFILDTRKEPTYEEITIPEEGFIVWPGRGYLGSTVERAGSDYYVPDIGGKSRTGRYFLSVHSTAGWGDTTFSEDWTLEISCIQPVRIYAGDLICQIRFTTVEGEITPYDGNYKGQSGPTGPRYKEK